MIRSFQRVSQSLIVSRRFSTGRNIFFPSLALRHSPSTEERIIMADFYADSKAPVSLLTAKSHFEKLTEKEQFYAHYFSKAAHFGTRVVLRQVSPESEAIYDLIISLYSSISGDFTKLHLNETEREELLEYFSQFLGNLGNYKSFGDVKFVPRISQEKFAAACADGGLSADFDKVKESIYSIYPPASTMLGYPESGHVTGYYPSTGLTISKAEVEAIHDAVGGIILPENTRILKTGEKTFEMLISSAVTAPIGGGDAKGQSEFSVDSLGATVKLVYGDHAREMGKIAEMLDKAREYAANKTQERMLVAYSASFREGSMQEHKVSQKEWVRDIGPSVETNIGFIETYRDPAGIRGEWEGLIAMVNKERTKTFGALVEGAKKFISLLPWDRTFEKDEFTPPDFTSLEVMTFAGSGIPAGINIPNYDDIRQTIGFKNVSLGNVLNARSSKEKVPFIAEQDIELYEKLRGPAFEVQVGIHELLGHGSGKLLTELEPGKFNFANGKVISPLDNQVIETYYRPGQTWGSVFGAVAGAYEECRAECVAMYLCPETELLEIFGHTDTSTDLGLADDVVFIAYLLMARAGLVALEYWDPQSGKWGQPHMQARFSILKQFLEYGDGSFVVLAQEEGDSETITIQMDRTKIASHGRPAVAAYLNKLHIYKSSGDAARGVPFFLDASSVPAHLAKLRPIVLANKLPRRQFVQANTEIVNGKVIYKEYEESALGMIKSFAERSV
ncbi:peptidase family M49-domain-containing protein [Lipomyces oligophaga]|uniref:peptidase family M49-domain-containing protein n=1 Tax=Lipomyces oligophaga TaxID=45792 RepID=UPI0034CF019A